MKNILKKGLVGISLSTFLIAGGDILPVEQSVSTSVILTHDTSGWYGGGAIYYSRVYSVDSKWFDDNTITQDEIGELTGIVGYNYNEYLAFEARASLSLFQEDYAEVYNYSFLVKPQYRFRDEDNYEDDYLTIYGLIGFGYVNVEGTDGDAPGAPEIIGKTLVDDWQFQYGIGLSYTFVDTKYSENDSGDISVFVEYMMHMNDASMQPTRLYHNDSNLYDELSMDSLNVGLIYHF